MMLYEVNLKIKKEAGQAFLKWLPGHMERVLKAEGFSKASLFHGDKNENESDDLKLTVFYKVKTREDLESYFITRMGYTEKEYKEIFNQEKHYWTEFKTYKKRFELFRPIFKVLRDAGKIPDSFYNKYCFKN